jgi:hypothetical protein
MLASACVSDVELLLPERGGAQAMIIVARKDARVLAAFARSAETPLSRAFTFDAGAVITVLYYERPLTALSIGEGPLMIAGEHGRRLPDADVIFERRGGEWVRLDELDPVIAALKIAQPSHEQCALAGGCYATGLECVLPCPEPPSPASPAQAALPEPPRTICPRGWSQIAPTDGSTANGSITACVAGVLAVGCVEPDVAFTGDIMCTRIGGDCPLGQGWPEDLASDAIYVRAGSTEPYMGTREQPFATLGAALAAAGDGATIALAAGSHVDAGVTLERDVHIVGACAAATIDAPIAIEGAVVELANVRITRPLVSSGELDLDGVFFEGAPLTIAGGRLTGREVAFAGTPSTALFAAGAALELSRVSFIGVSGRAIHLAGAATATITDLFVRDTTVSTIDSTEGEAVAIEGASAKIARAAILRANAAGVSATATASVVIEDLAVVDTATRTIDDRLDGGYGLLIDDGAIVSVDRAYVLRGKRAAVSVTGGAKAIVRDSIFEHQDNPTEFGPASGAFAGDTGELTLIRVFVGNVRGSAIVARTGAKIAMSDVIARRTLRGARLGAGFAALDGHLEATRVLSEENKGFGIYVHNGTALLDDVTTIHTGADDTTAIVIDGTARGRGARWHVASSGGDGIHIGEEARPLAISDVFVHHTDTGIVFSGDPDVTIARVLVEDVNNRGIEAKGTRKIVLEDVVVRRVLQTEMRLVVGVRAARGALELRRFVVEDTPGTCFEVGVCEPLCPQLDLHEGRARGPLGAAVFQPNYPFQRLLDRVLWEVSPGPVFLISP